MLNELAQWNHDLMNETMLSDNVRSMEAAGHLCRVAASAYGAVISRGWSDKHAGYLQTHMWSLELL